MTDLPQYLERGERARLFPVLKDTSKEGRCTSIFLSCLCYVQEFGEQMLKSVGQRVGKYAKVLTYTEVTFTGQEGERPDGLIVLRVGKREWKALVETKVGNNKLEEEQISAYVNLARKNNIDAVITISNQFTSKPDHHPVNLSPATKRTKVQVYHWSWWYIVTQAYLLISNTDIADEDQHLILEEMLRFLEHESTGVKRFDRMPSEWKSIVQKVANGSPLQKKADNLDNIVSSWHQEIQDIDLMLSREANVKVKTKLSRRHTSDPEVRIKDDIADLIKEHSLIATLEVPDAAALIEISANIRRKAISASMVLIAPSDKKTNSARLNWLLRQLRKSSEEDVHIGFHWPGRKIKTQYPLSKLKEDPKIAVRDNQYKVVRFEVSMIRHLTKRFGQPKSFISDLEQLVSNFYENVGQHLRAYQPPAPKIREDKSESESITPEG
ncbi:MAG: hypothetical protein F4Y00_00675 [Bacteroidetes bacterium SB0662_bin_6]|nr:hypothetical protein [Bacteroidetes bacterium SB0662_bin_6]